MGWGAERRHKEGHAFRPCPGSVCPKLPCLPALLQANQHYGGQYPTDVHVESDVQNPTGVRAGYRRRPRMLCRIRLPRPDARVHIPPASAAAHPMCPLHTHCASSSPLPRLVTEQKSFANEWHTWALEWSLDGSMVWKLDDDTGKGSIFFYAQSGDGTPLGW